MTLASLTPVHASALSPVRRGPGQLHSRQRPQTRITPQLIQQAIDWQPRYQPRDAADFCGVSEDRVTDSILSRPEMFPARQRYARRHDWDKNEFVRVIASVCSLCPKAKRHVISKLNKLSEI